MNMVEVEVARIVDRDHLLEALAQRGVEAHAVEEDDRLTVEVPCPDGEHEELCDDLVAELESWVMAEGIPLVPVRTDDSIFLRPPAQ
jgi:hypothetical protein